MADVVLKDASGTPNPYTGVDAVTLATEGGGQEKFVSERLIQKQQQADWNQEVDTEVDFIKNKPTIPAAQIPSDWNQWDSSQPDYIKNKPTIPKQKQADWEEKDTESPRLIRNKPFGSIPDFIKESTISFGDSTDEETGFSGAAALVSMITLEVGKEYIFTVNGVNYTGKSRLISVTEDDGDIAEYVVVGNSSYLKMLGDVDTANDAFASFLVVSVVSADFGVAYVRGLVAGDYTVRLRLKDNIRKIDKMWLPDELFKGSSLEKTISYDFATSGVPAVKVDFDFAGYTVYKISNETPILSELQGAKMVASYNPDEYGMVEGIVDVSQANLSIDELFISQTFGGSGLGRYSFGVVYEAGDINLSVQGTDFVLNIPETGFYLIYDLGATPPSTWRFSLTYTKYIETLPSVSERDNGKILGVVDGKWTKVNPPEGTSLGEEIDVISEQEIPFDGGSETGKSQVKFWSIVDGESYSVRLNGQEYGPYVATEGGLGNRSLEHGGEDTGEPLFIEVTAGLGITMLTKLDVGTPETVEIIYNGEVVASADKWILLMTNTCNVWTGFHKDMKIPEGEEIRVVWDGVEYKCTQTSMNIEGMNIVLIGNQNLMESALADTGEPFIVIGFPDGGVYLSTIYAQDNLTSHKVRLYYTKVVESVEIKETDLLPEQDIMLPNEGPSGTEGFWSYIMGFAPGSEQYESMYAISNGSTYYVMWDGVEYKCVAQDVSSVYSEMIPGVSVSKVVVIGNMGLSGGIDGEEIFQDTGEPFVMVLADLQIENQLQQMLLISTKDSTNVESLTRTVRVFTRQYLGSGPYTLIASEDYLLEEQDLTFVFSESDQMFMWGVPATEEITRKFNSKWEKAIVTWDGVQYECSKLSMVDTVFIGDISPMMGGEPSMPFIMGVVEGVMMIGSWADTFSFDGSTTTAQHKVSVQLVSYDVALNPKYSDLRPNWDETDENHPSFIRNKPFGESTVIIPLTTLDLLTDPDSGLGIVTPELVQIWESTARPIEVVWDGVAHQCSMKSADYRGFTLKYVGNAHYFSDSFEDTGEPFLVGLTSLEGFIRLIQGDPGVHTVSVAISGKIDKKYLPDDISGLPAHTDEDEGKFLRVVGGKAGWFSVLNAEEVYL